MASITTKTPIETSASDDRAYHAFTLTNNLKCLVVSDPTADKASAALDVNVGQYSDTIPGLAHFLEHMLFMGTSKYPDENDYQAHLSQHGGNSNAFTDLEHTNYYFDISATHLHSALDRFAQFFISPLLNPSSLERERQAVDSEHAKNLQSDHWRFFQLSKTICNPNHPFHNFGSGNSQTLSVDGIRDSLLEFYAEHYSAHNMALVVYGAESIDQLTTWVEELFSDIPCPATFSPYSPPTELAFTESQLAKRVRVVPVREHTRTVVLTFPMRQVQSLYKSKPTHYLSHLLGHEGQASVLSLLKEKHWAHELSAGASQSCSDWSSFDVALQLTETGLEHLDDVVQVVFAYLNHLREVGPQEWVHEETSTVADCSFRFLSKRNPMDYTSALAGFMHLYPPEHTLSGPYKIYDYDPDKITECLSYLTPENMILMVAAKEFEDSTDQTEKWYGTKYSVQDLDTSLLESWRDASIDTEWMTPKMGLPQQNDMIATDFSLRKVEGVPTDQPTLLHDTDTCRLWYKPDNVFDMPKVNFMAHIRTAIAYESPESNVLSSLWSHVLEEHCNEFTYLASMAGLHCSITHTRTGVEVHVSGYNHKMNILIERVIHAIGALPEKLTEELFSRQKEKLTQQFQSVLFAQPYQHAMYGSDLCVLNEKWTVEENIAAIQPLTRQDLVELTKRLLSRFHVEVLVHGNASPEEATEMCNTLLNGLNPATPFASNLPESRVVQLQSGTDYVYRFREFNETNTNSSVKVLYQIGAMDLRTNATLAFLSHLIKEPAFNELRTEEQLGYIVHTSVDTAGDDIKGLLFLIQSDAFDPIHLDGRVEAFLERFRSKIVQMSAEEFQINIDAVVKNFMEKVRLFAV
jgi:insulysin